MVQVSSVALGIGRSLYNHFFYSPHWRVGWRAVADRDLWDTQTLEGTKWNTLPDAGFRFYADPFAIVHKERTVLFMEEYDHRRAKGLISCVEFTSDGPSGTAVPVLEERWHLSYPFLIEYAGEIWMIPESSQNREIALYRADPFPSRWKRECVLIADIVASDATVVWHEDRFWLFATVEVDGDYSKYLHLFMSKELFGPWTPHKGNPVLVDSSCARPAGAMVQRDGRLWRPVQNCRSRYGASIGLAEVVRLDPGGYQQRVQTVLAPCRAWPGRRLHTLNRAGSFEFIDGSANSLRLPHHALALQSGQSG